MSAIEGNVWIMLAAGCYASHVTLPTRSSQIAGVKLRLPGNRDEQSRFDLGKQIFIDDIDGLDRHMIPKARRRALGEAIASVAESVACVEPPFSKELLRALWRAAKDAHAFCQNDECKVSHANEELRPDDWESIL